MTGCKPLSNISADGGLEFQRASEQTPGMEILISNDDGIEATGIRVLAAGMRGLGGVTIVAPDKNRSGASNSLTLDSPIRIKELEKGVFRVAGTPTDCVHVALTSKGLYELAYF